MVTIGMNYKVREGKEEPFVKKFKNVLDALEGTTGHVRTHLYKDVFEGYSYLVVSEWSEKEAFDAFIASDTFKKVTDWGTTHILSGRPEHKVYGSTEGIPFGASKDSQN